MREIKFRAWHEKLNIMVYNLSVKNSISEWVDESGKSWCFEENIMQFTGLHDKNGKEIYEGDVVHGSYGIPPRGVTSVVEYKESAFVIDTTGHKPESVTLKTGMECLDLEVIGNIHENPELMK